jgi:hypothetical protein
MYDVGEGRVFMGPQLLDVPALPKATAMTERGITMVINLWHGRDDALAAAVADYVHVPVPDGRMNDDSFAHYDVHARLAARAVANGGSVLTQCQGGRNRSGLLAGLTLCYWLGISGNEAVARVRAGRGGVAIRNPHFQSWLKSIPAHAA